MTTATRAAGVRFMIAGAHIALIVLAIVVLAEKMFGLKKLLQRTLMVRDTVQEQLETSREKKSMLELVLEKSRANLGSLSSVDDDDEGADDNCDENGARGSTSCPLCGGTGKIVYEGKMRHEDPCPRCAMIRGG